MVELRPAEADAPVSVELLTEYFEARRAGFPGAYRPTFPDAATFSPPAGVFLVVLGDDGEPVGCGGIRRVPPGPAGTRYEVKHLYLRPSTRGRGWGVVLLDDLERRARMFGAAELVLDTHHTLTAAGGLYARSGFVPIEPYNDNSNATVWLGKPLVTR